jgi:tetratricopeptide (TPR) repeat protein
MNEHRFNAYLELIQRLLDCPQGQELALLQANQALVDPDLVNVMEQIAAQLVDEQDVESAQFLNHWATELKNLLALTEASASTQSTASDRTQDYMVLIKDLLSCRKGAEPEVLQAHSELIDAGLVRQMEQVAAMLADKGDEADSHFLSGLARQLATAIAHTTSQPAAQQPTTNPATATLKLHFLQHLLQVIQQSSGNPEAFLPLFQQYRQQFDLSFIQALHTWADTTLAKAAPEQALKLAADLVILSDAIQLLPDASQTLREIAIAGYQIALPLFPHTTFPQQWAIIQTHLGETYCQQNGSNQPEHLEAAIHCFQDALQVYTHDQFPREWAMVQKDLGDAYRHRMQGDRTKNLEKAVAAYAAALEVYAEPVASAS